MQLESLVDEIESEIQQRAVREVTSNEIGEFVLQNLQSLSEVAYVRFASVYRQFQGITDFVETLNHLKGKSSSTETELQTADSVPSTEASLSEVVTPESPPSFVTHPSISTGDDDSRPMETEVKFGLERRT